MHCSLFGPSYLAFASCYATHHLSRPLSKCSMTLYLAGAGVVCVPFQPPLTCVVTRINGPLLVAHLTTSPLQGQFKTRPLDIFVFVQERSVSSMTVIIRERNIGVSSMGKSIPLRPSVNLLIRVLCSSTRDIKQQHSRLYQRAKASRQGGMTLTTPELEYRRREWFWLLRQVRTSWCVDKIREYARLLAAHHSVGDSNVPTWVHQVYRDM